MFRCLLFALVAGAGAYCVPAAADGIILKGTGATFPEPLYRKWIEVYEKVAKVRVGYEAVGSGAGIRALLERTADFGATDAFLSDTELASASAEILHIPTCVGAVAIIYNLPGEPQLQLSPEVIAALFMGEIRTWADPRLRRDNPGVNLPALPVQIVHRSDGSGTTFIFTDYLAKVSLRWRTEMGSGKSVRWPAGIGVEGNPRAAGFVKKIPGSLGYVSLSYARENGLPAASVRNRAGRFVRPTLPAVSEAAQVPMPEDARIMITDTSADNGYPIGGFTYILLYREQSYDGRTRARAQTLQRFLEWALTDGQAYCEGLNYSRLPDRAVAMARSILARMQYDGHPLAAQRQGVD